MKNAYAKREPIKPELVDKAHRFSFFKLIRQIWGENESLAMHRFCTLMRKMGAKWLIREELEPNATLQEEFEAIKRRCGRDTPCEALRLTFFADAQKEGLPTKLACDSLIGYVIVINISFEHCASPSPRDRTYIFESVVRFPSVPTDCRELYKVKSEHKAGKKAKMFCAFRRLLGKVFWRDTWSLNRIPLTNHYYHCANTFETTIGTKSKHTNYTIPGTFFAQQNDLTSVCAHVCLQMAINNSPALGVERLTSEGINRLLGIDHNTPKTQIGHFKLDKAHSSNDGRPRGLTTPEINIVVDKLGLHTLYANFLEPDMIDCYRWVHPHLESSFPTILGIQRLKHGGNEQVNHVVVVLGHTMNSDRWEPEARSEYRELVVSPYYSTSDWIDHFIINDDNLGMGRAISTDQLRDTDHRRKTGKLHPSMAITIVPKKITNPGVNTEMLASAIMHYLIKNMRGTNLSTWQRVLTRSKITCRTFASTPELYLNHMANCEDNFGNKVAKKELKVISEHLSGLLWITEVSVADLFCGNKAKLGDVVSSVDFNYVGKLPDDLAVVKFIWCPELAVLELVNPKLLHWPLTGYIPMQRPIYGAICPVTEW